MCSIRSANICYGAIFLVANLSGAIFLIIIASDYHEWEREHGVLPFPLTVMWMMMVVAFLEAASDALLIYGAIEDKITLHHPFMLIRVVNMMLVSIGAIVPYVTYRGVLCAVSFVVISTVFILMAKWDIDRIKEFKETFDFERTSFSDIANTQRHDSAPTAIETNPHRSSATESRRPSVFATFQKERRRASSSVSPLPSQDIPLGAISLPVNEQLPPLNYRYCQERHPSNIYIESIGLPFNPGFNEEETGMNSQI